MLRRVITALLLLVLIVPAIAFGGIIYFVYVAFFIVTACWEYIQIFRAAHFRPSALITVGGTFLLLAARAFRPDWTEWVFTGLILAAMTYHLIAYECGRHEAALDFVISLGGIVYLGWIGGYILDLRALPHGGWWVMLVFPVVWLTDSGAYMIGARYGTHKMLQRLSPKKSWEGFLA